jgi:hypothetical protein
MNRGIVGAIALASLTLVIVMLALLLFSTPMVFAEGVTDENLTTKVTVQSVPLEVGAITCEPSSLTPVIGSNKTMRCYSTITSLNGYGAIDQHGLNATLWIGGMFISTDDLNNHYSNGSSSNAGTNCCWGDTCNGVSSGNTIVVSCNFTTRYFIDVGTWAVNFTLNDTGSNVRSNSTSYTVNSVLGINAVQTSIDFGSVALGGEKNTSVTIQNVCNQIIDLTLAETNATGKLVCGGSGSANLSTDGDTSGVRYNKTNTDVWSSMELLTGANVNYEQWSQIYPNATGTGDTTQSDTLYWTLRMNATGISGLCSGTTRITVKADA